MNSRLRTLIKKRVTSSNKNCNTEEGITWFTVPYFQNISEQFKNFLTNPNIKLAFYSLNKLDWIIRGQKDLLTNNSKKNVVYKISCEDCDATYVGQTKRKLKTRITEHHKQINNKASKMTVIAEHGLSHNHNFDWSNVEIMDNERYYWKRIISEMIHIQLQDNALNQQTDTEYLQNTYTSILNKI